MRLAGVGGEGGGEIDFETMSCCVVVQEMVAQPRAAGVMFTVSAACLCVVLLCTCNMPKTYMKPSHSLTHSLIN